MEIIKAGIEGLIILKPRIFKDNRGAFCETYNEKLFRQAGIQENFVQDNQSVSGKNVIRGLHFQNPPYAQAKLVRVARGAALDVAVDIRRESPTYGKHYSVLLSGENGFQFFIPVGFAHGFAALEEDTVFCYKCSDFYNQPAEGALLFNDPDLQIDWQIEDPVVSDKDRQAELFAHFDSKF